MEGKMEDAINEEGKWKVLKSEYLFQRPWLTIRKDCVELPNGQQNPEYYVLEYPDWVNIVAVTDEGEFVMERQYRHGLGKTCYEIPAGVIEKGESPLDAAKRELQEETGYGEGKWEEVLTLSGNSSTTNNLTHSFIAEGVKKISGQHLDRTEDLHVEMLNEAQVKDLLVNNQVVQSLMAAPLWRYFAIHKLL
jgi:8-oxo-dGTP pyrophosphatase MutT (NUDIX family)